MLDLVHDNRWLRRIPRGVMDPLAVRKVHGGAHADRRVQTDFNGIS